MGSGIQRFQEIYWPVLRFINVWVTWMFPVGPIVMAQRVISVAMVLCPSLEAYTKEPNLIWKWLWKFRLRPVMMTLGMMKRDNSSSVATKLFQKMATRNRPMFSAMGSFSNGVSANPLQQLSLVVPKKRSAYGMWSPCTLLFSRMCILSRPWHRVSNSGSSFIMRIRKPRKA